MKIVIVGAGPAGLYLSLLLKRCGLDLDLTVYEQNAPDATFGFGVVFSDSALEFLKDDDPATHAAITPELERWSNIKIAHRGRTMTIDGVGFTAVGRLHLLTILQREARSAGVDIRYNEPVRDLAQFHDADLIVGADGLNSLVRGSDETRFGTTIRHLTNRFAWFGTTKTFDALTQTFVASRYGHFNAHHYRYAPAMSTFIIECDETTFLAGGFDTMGEDQTRVVMQDVFAEALDGHALVSNRSVWRRFPVVRNETWSAGNKVILGDALHTAHFSIGSGTRLAIEDAIALVRALKAHRNDVPEALARYEAERKPVLDVLVNAANASAAWYERFAEHMALPPYEFAMSYLMRTGRMTETKLRRQSPRFMADYERHRGAG